MARRMRGEDSIFAEKRRGKHTGRFIAKLYYRVGRKRKAKQLVAKSAAEARTLLKKLRDERDAGTLAKRNPSTLAGFFETWLKMPSKKRKTRAESTVHGYRSHFQTHIDSRLGHKKLESVNQTDIIDLDLSLESTSTRQAVFGLLRAIFNTAAELEIIAKSPLDKLRQPKHVAERWTPLTTRQQITFVSAVANDW